MPAAEALKALIDAEEGLQAEAELSLVEDTFSPPYDSVDEAGAVSRELKRIALKALLVVVLVQGGWFVYSNFPAFFSHLFQALVVKQSVGVVAPPAAVPRQSPPAVVVSRPGAQGLADESRAQAQEAAALQKQKYLAWAAFYSAPASCEHPTDWDAQVECGNKYMRAKKLFEQGWGKDHPASHGSGAVVLDNSSIHRPQK